MNLGVNFLRTLQLCFFCFFFKKTQTLMGILRATVNQLTTYSVLLAERDLFLLHS